MREANPITGPAILATVFSVSKALVLYYNAVCDPGSETRYLEGGATAWRDSGITSGCAAPRILYRQTSENSLHCCRRAADVDGDLHLLAIGQQLDRMLFQLFQSEPLALTNLLHVLVTPSLGVGVSWNAQDACKSYVCQVIRAHNVGYSCKQSARNMWVYMRK
jgi:hypothetical protein